MKKNFTRCLANLLKKNKLQIFTLLKVHNGLFTKLKYNLSPLEVQHLSSRQILLLKQTQKKSSYHGLSSLFLLYFTKKVKTDFKTDLLSLYFNDSGQ